MYVFVACDRALSTPASGRETSDAANRHRRGLTASAAKRGFDQLSIALPLLSLPSTQEFTTAGGGGRLIGFNAAHTSAQALQAALCEAKNFWHDPDSQPDKS